MLQRNKAGLNRFSYQFDKAYLPQKVSRKLLHHFNAHSSNLRQPLFLNFAALLILLEDEKIVMYLVNSGSRTITICHEWIAGQDMPPIIVSPCRYSAYCLPQNVADRHQASKKDN